MSTTETRDYKYIAFICYRHSAKAVAKRLERSIEHYVVPKRFRKKDGGKKLGKAFRDEDELSATNDLSEDLKKALDQSRYLMVVCTPDLPKNKWCETTEIGHFLKTRDLTDVVTVLADGKPEESIPLQLRPTKKDEENENVPLAANLTNPDSTFRKEITRIYAKILGCDFDELWQRERRARTIRISTILAMVFAVMASFIGVVLNRNAQISAQNRQITLQNEQITEQNGQITRQIEEIQLQNDKIEEQNEQITEQYSSLRRQFSTTLVEMGLTRLENSDIKGALEDGLDALLTEEEADLRDPRAELLLGEALGAYAYNLRTRMVYDQASEITDMKKTTDGRYLLLADQGGAVRCLSTEDYRVLWTANIGGLGFDPPVEILLPEREDLVLCKTVWNITARSLADGKEVWSYTLQGQALNRFRFLSGDTLLVLDHYSEEDSTVMLRALDVNTGTLMGETPLAPEGETVVLDYRQPFYNWAAAFSPEGDRCAVAYFVKLPQESEARETQEKASLRFTVFSTTDWSVLWSSQIKERPFSDTERQYPTVEVFYGMEFMSDGSIFCARYRDAYRSLILTRLEANGSNVTQNSFSHSLSIGTTPVSDLSHYRHNLIPMLTDGVWAIVCSERTAFFLDARGEITGTSVQFSEDIRAVEWKDMEKDILRIWTKAGELIEYTLTKEPGIHYNSTIFTRHFEGAYDHTYFAILPEAARDTGRLGLLAIPETHPGRLLLTEAITDPQGNILPGQPDNAIGCNQIVLTPSGERIMAFFQDNGLTAIAYDPVAQEEVDRVHIDEYSSSCVPTPLDNTHFLYGVRIYGMDGTVEYLDKGNHDSLDQFADHETMSVLTADGNIVTTCLNNGNYATFASSVWLDGKLVASSEQLPPRLELQVGEAQAVGKNGLVIASGYCSFEGNEEIPLQRRAFGVLNAVTGSWTVWEDPEAGFAGGRTLAAGTATPIFASASGTGRVCLFHGETETVTELPGDYSYGEIAALCFAPGDEYLLILTHQARLDIWSLEKQQLVFSELQKTMEESMTPGMRTDMTCDRDRDGRLQVLVRLSTNLPGFWLCIDPNSWVVTARAEDVHTGALGDGRLYAQRNGKLVSYPLRDAATLKAWAEEVLEATVQEGD